MSAKYFVKWSGPRFELKSLLLTPYSLLLEKSLLIFLFSLSFLALSPKVEAQSLKDAAYYYELGRSAMVQEDWYTAAEDFLECLKLNPAHAQGTAAIAECYYELGEYDEALTYIRKARALSRLNMETANLEAFILIAQGRLTEAGTVIKDVQTREPYNKQALFAAAELDIAQGHSGEAVRRYREAVRLYPDDRRLLLSLALVLGSMGDSTAAREYIERSQVQYPDDWRVYYYAAYLEGRSGRLNPAIRDAERSLELRPNFLPALSLLAGLRYRTGNFEETIRLADTIINADRENAYAWYIKGLSLSRLGRNVDARTTLERAIGVDPNDEFIRVGLENLILETTSLEDPQRANWAKWHFDRAQVYGKRGLGSEAVFEYRRGLRIDPYSPQRREYAEVLRLQGLNELYLEELKFLQGLNLGSRAVNDAVETYSGLIGKTLRERWQVEGSELKRHWNVAIFSINGQSAFYHTDAAYIAANYLRDILSHDRNINPVDIEIRQPGFAEAFRSARQTSRVNGVQTDYFLVINVLENERDLSVKADLYVARTGAAAASFSVFRAGQDRLRNSVRNITEQLDAALPFRGTILRRAAGDALIDKGKLDGVEEGIIYEIVKKGKVELASEGIGLKYLPQDIAGTFTAGQITEELSTGTLNRQGFFDLITEGDEIFVKDEKSGKPDTASQASADPELRAMLRTLK